MNKTITGSDVPLEENEDHNSKVIWKFPTTPKLWAVPTTPEEENGISNDCNSNHLLKEITTAMEIDLNNINNSNESELKDHNPTVTTADNTKTPETATNQPKISVVKKYANKTEKNKARKERRLANSKMKKLNINEDSQAGTSSRDRKRLMEDSTASNDSNCQPPKKVKQNSYAEVVTESLLVEILYGEGEGSMTAVIHKQMMKELLEVWDKLPPGDGRPSFVGHGLNEKGIAWIKGANVEARDWVVRTVGELSSPDFPISTVIPEKMIDFTVVVPYNAEDPPLIQDILKRLEDGPNKGLKTNKWRVVGSERPSQRGWALFVGLDRESFDVLNSLDFRPYYGFGRLYFNLRARRT